MSFMKKISKHILSLIFLTLLSFNASGASPQTNDELVFDDSSLTEDLYLPDWFSLSFLDLNDSLNDAVKDGKKGMIIYFGRKDCAYCKSLLENNWGDPAIEKYTRQHFNVIAMDVRGDRNVVDFDGSNWNEKSYAAKYRTNFTPTLHFYNSKGQLALKLPGYRPKYQFRASLEYVADAHYTRETFRKYLARAETAMSFGLEELNENDHFMEPPYNLARNYPIHKNEQRKPLAVFFEHKKCHACDVLHGDTLNNPEVITQLKEMDIVQLNTATDTPVITPSGTKTTSKKWADELNLTFAPSLLFFDDKGKEVIRVESVIRLNRLNNVLRYVIGEEHKHFSTLQAWLHYKRSQKNKDK